MEQFSDIPFFYEIFDNTVTIVAAWAVMGEFFRIVIKFCQFPGINVSAAS